MGDESSVRQASSIRILIRYSWNGIPTDLRKRRLKCQGVSETSSAISLRRSFSQWNPVRLIRGPVGYPAWSPDGTHIAYVSRYDRTAEIYVMDDHGNNPVNVTDYRGVGDLDPA
jgi:Tol biopolymer transport system component